MTWPPYKPRGRKPPKPKSILLAVKPGDPREYQVGGYKWAKAQIDLGKRAWRSIWGPKLFVYARNSGLVRKSILTGNTSPWQPTKEDALAEDWKVAEL